MFRPALYLNALLAIPFGLACFVTPVFVFAQFGMPLDPVAVGVARGYAATALALGVVFLLFAGETRAGAQRALLIGSLVFNGLEVILQVPFWFGGMAGPGIWGTILGHAIAFALSVAAFRGLSAADTGPGAPR
jgi:hypothetical protein